METKGGGITSIVDNYAKVARDTANYLYERAAVLEKDMSSFMPASGKGFATTGEGTMLDRFIERNPGRAALFALMGGVMATRMASSRGAGPWTEMVHGMVSRPTAVAAPEPLATAKPKRTARSKRAVKARAKAA